MDDNVKDSKQLKDEQELAKVLAGINDQANVGATATPVAGESVDPAINPTAEPTAAEAIPTPDFEMPSAPGGSPAEDLEAIKQKAINDLRPLVDKLDLPDDEKFNTYLLLIRSTNDSSLVSPAYDVAKRITDDTKRAQALLDIVKEIDYFTNPPAQAA